MSKELNPEYRNVRFRCDQKELPSEFWIVTACNPDGKSVTHEENDLADAALLKLLSSRSYPHFRVIGGSADFSHAEPGYGIVCSQEEALTMARKFRQDAIFEVRDGDVLLLCAKSESPEAERLGPWEARLDP